MRKSLLLFMTIICVSVVTAQVSTLSPEDQETIINNMGRSLIERYVFPEVGKKCADLIRSNLKNGEYVSLADPAAFAQRLTDDLQGVSSDRHMRVRLRQRPNSAERSGIPAYDFYLVRRQDYLDNFGFRRAEVMEGNIGYIDMSGFSGAAEAKQVADAAMKIIENTDAVIMDMRRNGGGNPEMVRYVCSYFFNETVHLNSLYWRAGDRTEEYWTSEVPGKRRGDVPLFVLTARRTFSGAEEFTYNLKTRKRATIIGETTGGGANPGGAIPVGHDLIVFIPTGRAINPVTGTNWEGVGVEPDIKIEADSALDTAIRLAKEAGKNYNARINKNALAAFQQLQAHLAEAEQSLKNDNRDHGYELLVKALTGTVDTGLMDEGAINSLGYQYLGEKKNDMAIAIFKFNTHRFPGSSNVYDSLGEAFKEMGDLKRAIENYQKSLNLNPENPSAIAILKELGVEWKRK